jgi:hypothetical protein
MAWHYKTDRMTQAERIPPVQSHCVRETGRESGAGGFTVKCIGFLLGRLSAPSRDNDGDRYNNKIVNYLKTKGES